MKKIIFLFFAFPLLATAQKANTVKMVDCDSIYAKKGLSVTLVRYEHEEEDGYFGEKNSVFIFSKKVNGVVKEIYRDTVFSKVQQIHFDDFNGDKIKDILVQNTSSARSSWTYTLYLVNPKNYTLTKVKGFDTITEPMYNQKYDIVESYALAGEDHMLFYKIIKNHIYDYKISIVDDHQDDGSFDRDYEKAIQKIQKRNKTLLKK